MDDNKRKKANVLWLKGYTDKAPLPKIKEADLIFVEIGPSTYDVVKNCFNGMVYRYATKFVCDHLVKAHEDWINGPPLAR